MRWSRLRPAERLILVAIVLFTVSVGALTASDATKYPGLDLRTRVLGARAILHGLNPYDYAWKPGDAETLADPWRRLPGPTRTTYTPPLLLAYLPLAPLGWKAQRPIWYALEWVAMLAVLTVGLRVANGRAAKLWFLAIACGCFVGDLAWRLHLERGQYYVFVALLLMLAFAELIEKRARWVAPVALGCAIAFRPTFGLIALVLLLAGRRRDALRALGIAAALCLVTLPIVGLDGWRAYFKLVHYHSSLTPDALLERDFGPALKQAYFADGVDWFPHLEANSGNVSYWWIFTHLFATKGPHGFVSRWPYEPIRLAGVALTSALGCAAAWWAGRRRLPVRWILVLGMVATLGADFFVAPERNSYSDILLLPLLALLVPLWRRVPKLAPAGAVALFACLLASSHVGFTRLCEIPNAGPLENWLRNLGLVGGAAASLAMVLAP